MRKIFCVWMVACVALIITGPLFAQKAQAPAARKAPARPVYPPRVLAPHVFTPINPYLDMLNITNIHDIGSVAEKDSSYTWARDVSFRSKVWYLNIEFKPLRVIILDLPGRDGKLQRMPVWYLIYKVRNPGDVFTPVAKSLDAQAITLRKVLTDVGNHPLLAERHYYEITSSEENLRFIPIFELVTLDAKQLDPATKKEKVVNRRYIDRFMPLAVSAICRKEDPGRKILDSVQMSNRVIRPGEEVWGVAVWSGVNPTVDHFSIYVSGLTNARKWFPDENDPTKGVYKNKTLKLNYWHPGDESPVSQRSDAFKMGYSGVLDYEWIFR
ncbi:MAG: hypothetical protein Q4D98_06840 [Planctomycetia bacterium]|nr:hypothetical protein [Planctomycetia bacterium]